MRIVIDEDLHRSFAPMLRELGHEVFDIRDEGLRGKTDREIFRFAQKKNAVLFSADLGFANMLKFPPGTHHGVVVLRFPNELSSERINTIVKTILAHLKDTDLENNLTIFTPRGARLRRKN